MQPEQTIFDVFTRLLFQKWKRLYSIAAVLSDVPNTRNTNSCNVSNLMR